MPASSIRAVAFVNEQIAWGVGEDGYIGYWNGQDWLQVASPTNRTLNDVAFFTPDHGVAVGDSSQLLYWNGDDWSLIYSYNEEPYHPYYLNDVTFVSATEIWAVGLVDSEGGSDPLMKRWNWDGQSWVEMDTGFDVYCRCVFYSVLMVSETDGWAVGFSDTTAVTLRWDGIQWELVPNPYSGQVSNWLYSMSGTAIDNIWVTGVIDSNDDNLSLLHWNGLTWSTVTTNIRGSGRQVLMLTPTQGYVVLSKGWGIACWDGQTWVKSDVEFSDPPKLMAVTPNGNTLILTRNGQFVPFTCL